MNKQINNAPYVLAPERVAEVTIGEFYGEFPIAKINFLKVFELAVSIFEEIAGL
jgi:hypothetical protein